jgi:hypothetical protein
MQFGDSYPISNESEQILAEEKNIPIRGMFATVPEAPIFQLSRQEEIAQL